MKVFAILTRQNPLQHYLIHFIIANIALLITYLIFESITIWEIFLFLFMTFFPLIDELFSAILHYLDDKESREIVNIFIAGEVVETLQNLHVKRNNFFNLTLHNIPLYLSLCTFMYILIIFDLPTLFYAMAGTITHLTLDIINDQYEFKSIRKWFWPVFNLFAV